MESGSVVRFSSKFRAPQFAARTPFARSFGNRFSFFFVAAAPLGFPEDRGFSPTFRLLAVKSRLLASATSPRRDFFCPFNHRPAESFFVPLCSAVHRSGAPGASNEQGNSLRCHDVHRLQAVRASLLLKMACRTTTPSQPRM